MRKCLSIQRCNYSCEKSRHPYECKRSGAALCRRQTRHRLPLGVVTRHHRLDARFPCLRSGPRRFEAWAALVFPVYFLACGSRGFLHRNPAMDDVSLRVHTCPSSAKFPVVSEKKKNRYELRGRVGQSLAATLPLRPHVHVAVALRCRRCRMTWHDDRFDTPDDLCRR